MQVNVNNEFVVGILIEETWKAMLDLRWITVAVQGRDQFYVVLTLAQRFTCKTLLFESGRCWDRTSGLCRVKADPCVRRCSLAFKNSCKQMNSTLEVPGRTCLNLPALVY